MYECRRRRASCLFIRNIINIIWEMSAQEKSKKQGIRMFILLLGKYLCRKFEVPAGH